MSELLQFENPPVTEAIISLQFSPVKFSNVYAGLLWNELKSRYAEVSEHPPLPPAFEMFGGKSSMGGNQHFPFPLNLSSALSMCSRYWFASADETSLMQIQRDRLVHNWRRRSSNPDYPSYIKVKGSFQEDLETFETFLKKNDLGEITPNQCEISYINVINFSDLSVECKNAHDITPLLAPEIVSPDGLKFEGSSVTSRFIILDESSGPCGRVHVNLTPEANDEGQVKLVRVEITARGRPDKSGGLATALDFLDILHEKAIAVFKTVISNALKESWGIISNG